MAPIIRNVFENDDPFKWYNEHTYLLIKKAVIVIINEL